MNDFVFRKSELEGVMLISPKQFRSENGSFEKNFEKEIYKANGIYFEVSEEYKIVLNKGVLKGIHFQYPCPQSRLVSISMGKALIVVVDLRKDSQQLGKWKMYREVSEQKTIIFIPKGFGLGTLALENNTIIEVKCSGQYFEKYSCGVNYNDKELSIDWKKEYSECIQVSEKDQMLMSFREYINIVEER